MAYVSREKIIEHIEKFYDTVPLYTDERHLIAGLKAYVENLPTADVTEVKHGEWTDNEIQGSMLSKCSLCGYPCGAYTLNFCPNCGAKMD